MPSPRPDAEAERDWPAPTRRCRVLLVAGEASGDLHAADLVAALRQHLPDVEVFGIGGERLREAGMRTVADSSEVATVGVTEATSGPGVLLARRVSRASRTTG